MFLRVSALFLALVFASRPASAGVIINEILYHAPEDLDDVQFIELHNTGDGAVELVGWKLASGVKYEFPARARIEANGFLVVCKDQKEFKRHYGFDAAGQYEG